ncbi:hypothetical protein EVB79_104 [Rhizobium phage RHph_N3_13]|nr:hypothetical protein EVB79_104 [Rhizobium phage RHph_N3_13]QIG69929.1 hypothetical protein F67_I3_11_103 [Rhizobium phage RHph_I3_11]QIG73099.1 hypothetical protein EVB99_108 [Rhizobium phage RHph_N3_19]
MNKELARDLAPIVNNKLNYDALLAYMDFRIEELKNRLVSATNMEEVKSIQGAIYEIGRLKSLRDEVNARN